MYIVIWPILALILGAQLRHVTLVDFDHTNTNLIVVGFLSLVIVYFYSVFVPRPTYLVDFACYCPPMELKVNILLPILMVGRFVFGSGHSEYMGNF